jgi:hypothetical protein
MRKESLDVSTESDKKEKYRQQRDPPFSAKVKRRWADTKSRVRKRLGQYAFVEPLPIGLYLDMVI